MSPEKGPDVFVRAMAAVQREAPATRAVIVGDGPMRPELEALAERCGARIEFTGRIAHPAVREWLRRATVFRSEEHTSELQSLMRISYAVFCLNKQQKQSTYRMSSMTKRK